MSEARSGPVKPPVIDLTARPAEGAGTAGHRAPGTGQSTSARDDAPEPGVGARQMGVAALGGGAVALLGAYLFAVAGLWPSSPPAEDPRLASVLADYDQTRQAASGIASLSERLTQLESDLDGALTQLRADVADLEARPVGTEAGDVDLSTIAARLATLEDILAAPLAAPDLSEVEARLASLEQGMSSLPPPAELSPLENRLADVESVLAGQAETLAELNRQPIQPASDQSDLATLVRLPILISSLESTMEAGRPYTSELGALTQALPDLEIAPSLVSASGSGLPHRQAVMEAFNEALPAMLAARPVAEGDMLAQSGEWLRGLLALRPVGDIPGDGPDAQLSRLEAALARADYVEADAAFSALPETMRATASQFATLLAQRADAQLLGDTLRRRVLALEAGA